MAQREPIAIPFCKMEGAGNDFIVVDDRDGTFPLDDKKWLARMAQRRTGVGCDGIVLIQSSTCADADVRMRFINPDGGEVSMCGNAARCVARFCHEKGIAGPDLRIQTEAGIVQTCLDLPAVRVGMTDPHDWKEGLELDAGETMLTCDFVNTGVPHAVCIVENLDAFPVEIPGRSIRNHRAFAPQGTNVDFIELRADGALAIRTYERGVEAETLSCGTGIVAAALVAAKRWTLPPPIRVLARSGDWLEVDFALAPENINHVWLKGPARFVYSGQFQTDQPKAACGRSQLGAN